MTDMRKGSPMTAAQNVPVLLVTVLTGVLAFALTGCTTSGAGTPTGTASSVAADTEPAENPGGVHALTFNTDTAVVQTDGSWFVTNPDGTQLHVNPDGSWAATGSDIGTITVNADGSWRWTGSPEGGVIDVNRDRSWTWIGGINKGSMRVKTDGTYDNPGGGGTPVLPAKPGTPTPASAPGAATPKTPINPAIPVEK